MTKLFKLQELAYKVEGAFLDGATNPGTTIYSERLPILTATCTLEQPRESDQTVQSRKNVSRAGFLGLRTATLEFQTFWPGLMTDPGTGTPTEFWFTELLSAGLGGESIIDDGGTVNVGTSATQFSLTGVSSSTVGAIMRVGSKNDGGGDGQAGVIGSISGGITLLTALPAAPSSGHAVRPTATIYPTEANPASTVSFRLAFAETGAAFELYGAQLESVRFDIDVPGGRPARVTWRYRAAYWVRSDGGFPGIAMPNTDTAVIAGGSLFQNTVGTATRAQQECGTLSLSLAMGLIPQMGPKDGQIAYSNINGWISQGCIPTLSYTVPYTTAAESEFDSDGSSTSYKHALFTANATNARCYGFYMPNMFITGAKPTYTERNGLLYVTKTYQGTDGPNTLSELTQSPIRFFVG